MRLEGQMLIREGVSETNQMDSATVDAAVSDLRSVVEDFLEELADVTSRQTDSAKSSRMTSSSKVPTSASSLRDSWRIT